MRAVYYPHFIEGDVFNIDDKTTLHHLLNVVRIKKNEEILILNGRGDKCIAKIETISKKNIQLTVQSRMEENKSFNIDLYLALLKKDSLSLALKQAVELGVNKIFLCETEFSQRYEINIDRLNSILISALEQSNNPFLPEIEYIKLNAICRKNYVQIFLMSMNPADIYQEYSLKSDKKYALMIGPEGGFSPIDIESFGDQEFLSVNLPTPILRAETAVSAGMGFLLSRLC